MKGNCNHLTNNIGIAHIMLDSLLHWLSSVDLNFWLYDFQIDSHISKELRKDAHSNEARLVLEVTVDS